MTDITDPDTGASLSVPGSAVRRHEDGVDPRVAELEAENARLREAVITERQLWFHELENLALQMLPKGRAAIHYAIRHMTAQLSDAALKETSHDG